MHMRVGVADCNNDAPVLSEPVNTSSMVKFVLSDANGLPQKRAGSQRACEYCRKRKKRCGHANDSSNSIAASSPPIRTDVNQNCRSASSNVHESNDDVATREPPPELIGLGQHQELLDGGEPSLNLASPATGGTSTDGSGADHRRPASTHLLRVSGSRESENESRFIGHLNPEGAFLAATSPAHTTGSGEVEEVGVWLSNKGRLGKRKRNSFLSLKTAQSDALYCPDPLVSKILLPQLEESCLSLLPVSSDFDALSSIYFDQIHPMFPIIDRPSFDASPAHLTSKVALSQVICLIASSSAAAKPFLGLHTNGIRVALDRAEFAYQLSLAIRTSLSLGLIKDKFALCQICALFSMSMQLADDRHLSAEMCARAVAYAQTLGLHLAPRADRSNSDTLSRVFCCIWALDRLNAAIHGRPVTMHSRDFGRDLDASISAQHNCFQLFLRTTILLDKVIDLYRPRNDASEADWGPEFPDFESIVDDAGALRVKHNLLATIETFYHAVAILSCRSQSTDQRRSPSYVRQSLSASKVISMVAEDLHGQLSPLPVVPYAVSLALRFFYREFRFTKVPLFRARAQKQLVTGCSILRTLGEAFVVAAGIASLVEQTLNETDKAYFSLVQSHDPERSKTSSELDTTIPNEVQSAELDTTVQSASIDWSLWDSIPGFDIFEHFDPNFNLDAVDAALVDDTQPVFPVFHDGFTI